MLKRRFNSDFIEFSRLVLVLARDNIYYLILLLAIDYYLIYLREEEDKNNTLT